MHGQYLSIVSLIKPKLERSDCSSYSTVHVRCSFIFLGNYPYLSPCSSIERIIHLNIQEEDQDFACKVLSIFELLGEKFQAVFAVFLYHHKTNRFFQAKSRAADTGWHWSFSHIHTLKANKGSGSIYLHNIVGMR
jgi:hypothetical protein